MTTHEFWREGSSGEVWAVELREGIVAGCCGPLDFSEIDEEFLDSFDYSTEQAAWIEASREGFTLYETAAPYA